VEPDRVPLAVHPGALVHNTDDVAVHR
jgi:hypothetical protein